MCRFRHKFHVQLAERSEKMGGEEKKVEVKSKARGDTIQE